jgi:hypothetical protein
MGKKLFFGGRTEELTEKGLNFLTTKTLPLACKHNYYFSTGISDTVPHWLLLQAGSNTTMITRHHHL